MNGFFAAKTGTAQKADEEGDPSDSILCGPQVG